MFLGNVPDLYPTLLDMMGLSKQIPSVVDGKSYATYFMNGKGTIPSEQFILGTINSHNPNSGFRGVRTADYKLAYVKAKGKTEPYFFDLKKDPFELNNIYNASDSRVKQLDKTLNTYLQKTNDPFTFN